MIPILIFVIGLLVGSFLNACIYRIPRDISIVAPRSFCPECGRQLAWFENVPLLSYLFLRRRCRKCSQPISWRYPAVEFVTGALFPLIANQYGLTLIAIKWQLFAALLIVLFWTDLEERILPDEVTLGGSVAGLLFALFVPVPGVFGELVFPRAATAWQSIFDAALGAVLLAVPIWLIGSLYGRIRKREALGLGDVKLLAMIGIFLGPVGGLSALTIGAVSGALVGIGVLIWTKKEMGSYELPFGSFLCLGAVLIPLFRASEHIALAVP